MSWGKVPGLRKARSTPLVGQNCTFLMSFSYLPYSGQGPGASQDSPPILWLCLQFILPALTTRHGFQRDLSALALNKGFPRHWGKDCGAVFKGWAAGAVSLDHSPLFQEFREKRVNCRGSCGLGTTGNDKVGSEP